MSSGHNVEGFVVLTTRDPDARVLITGGTLLGEQYIDMMTRDTPNPCQSFFSFVSGQAAIKQICGAYAAPPTNPRKHTRNLGDETMAAYNKGDLCFYF